MAREEIDQYDTIIVGGGIVGAGIFREHSLHNVKCLLLDRADFNSQTSQGSSKMLHGGIRYLENFDFALVFEALREKNLWLKLTPHITQEIPFYLPVFKWSKWPLFLLRIGLFLYDLLSLFKNTPHKIFNKKQTLERIKGLGEKGLSGSGLYYDGIVDDSKLGLECIYDGLNNKLCTALNYKMVTEIQGENGNFQVHFEDVLDQRKFTARARKVIFATGPFTDQVMQQLKIPWSPVILPSKGTHLWLHKDALPLDNAIVLQTKDGRIIFVIPQRETILVGTTEDPIDPKCDMLNIQPLPEEIEYLLGALAEYFPNNPVTSDQILESFSAVRPLVRRGESSKKTSRNHKIFEPNPGLFVIVGGKYTTFRKMAEDVNKKVFKQLGITHNTQLSKQPLNSTSVIKNPFERKITKEDIDRIIKDEQVRTKEDLIKRRLSLPSLRHVDDQELKQLLDSLDLETLR